MLLAYRAALASPHVTAAAIEATEFPALADEHEVWAVPKIVAGGASWEGAAPESVFFRQLLGQAVDG